MRKPININHLVINPENYRFDPVDNQGDAIDLMLEEKGGEILNLARHIFRNGLDEAKDIRVLSIKKDLFLVLDGNRRVTAIRCLDDPSLVKDTSLRKGFLKILKEHGRVPVLMSGFIYSSEEAASEWIKLDHTGKNFGVGQDPWEPSGKERFDYKFGGKTSPAMQTVLLFEHETKLRIDRKALKISTLNRILSNPESRSYLGIDVRGGEVVLTTTKAEAIKRIDRLFNKIIVDDVAVKEVYHVEDSITFMENLYGGDKPKSTASPRAVSSGGVVQTKKPSRRRILPRSISRTTLIPSSCILRITEPKINNIYHELRLVDIGDATNAVSVLFRVFIEISLDYCADRLGLAFGKNVKLAGKVTKVADHLEKKGLATRAQLKNIRKVPQKNSSILSIDNFHEYVHSFKVQPIPTDLIYKWDNLQEFFEILWEYMAKRDQKRK